MRRTLQGLLVLILVGLGGLPAARAAGKGDFQPDPKSVQRYGPAYRYPQAGWIVLHIEGKPYERGYQHGRLLAPEIAAHIRCAAAFQNSKSPSQGWRQVRTLVNALFLRHYDKEYLEEMKGIADGASAAGARFDNRPIDLVDVVGLNAWPEIDTLDSALNATETGLEGMSFPNAQPKAMPKPKPMHCSAFAATGPATADGKIVFGHITMFSLYPSLFYNVWLDVKPDKGYRVLMQTYPGGIQSGLDYYLNDAGILVCETTIAQTRFDIDGQTVASRIRKALQYADTIDRAVEILKNGNNGLYTNEWLLADIKTNEIAMFELGTHKSRLYRSSKHDWFGGTEGFYWGCNNTKDLQVRLETVASVEGRPANVVFRPESRDRKWLQLYHQYKGKIDANFGKVAFTTPPIAAYHSVDAKFTTTDLARQLKTWALYGPPLGRTWQPTQDERDRFPEIRPLVSNPWTILHTQPPAPNGNGTLVAADLSNLLNRNASRDRGEGQGRRGRMTLPPPAWHGTLLPKTDADVWLAAAFADYERPYAREKSLKESPDGKGKLGQKDRDELAVSLYRWRSSYLSAARAEKEQPLDQTRSALDSDLWYRIAAGKGVLLLQDLRYLLGDAQFEKAMDSFGREHAGKEVTTAEFQAHMEKAAGKKLDGFFAYWRKKTGLPRLQLKNVRLEELRAPGTTSATALAYGCRVTGEILRDAVAPPQQVEVTVANDKGEVTETVHLQGPVTRFTVLVQTGNNLPSDTATVAKLPRLSGKLEGAPVRVVVDPYGRSAHANGGVFTTLSFSADLEKTLIVYGTTDEVPTNREAAEALQKAIIERGPNYTVPIKSDREVTEEELKTHHLLLIGRPDSNTLAERFRAALPISFGSRSFVVRGKSYAHARSAVVVAAENPLNKRFSLVVVAGLSAEATLRAAPLMVGRYRMGAEVLLLAHGSAPQALALPARDLVYEVPKK